VNFRGAGDPVWTVDPASRSSASVQPSVQSSSVPSRRSGSTVGGRQRRARRRSTMPKNAPALMFQSPTIHGASARGCARSRFRAGICTRRRVEKLVVFEACSGKRPRAAAALVDEFAPRCRLRDERFHRTACPTLPGCSTRSRAAARPVRRAGSRGAARQSDVGELRHLVDRDEREAAPLELYQVRVGLDLVQRPLSEPDGSLKMCSCELKRAPSP